MAVVVVHPDGRVIGRYFPPVKIFFFQKANDASSSDDSQGEK